MYEQDIDYLSEEFNKFNENLSRIDRINNQIEMNENSDLLKEGKALRLQIIDLIIPKVAHAETKAHNNDSELKSLNAKIQDLEKKNQ